MVQIDTYPNGERRDLIKHWWDLIKNWRKESPAIYYYHYRFQLEDIDDVERLTVFFKVLNGDCDVEPVTYGRETDYDATMFWIYRD